MAEADCDLLCIDLERAEALRGSKVPELVAGELAGRAKALADPTRLTLAISLTRVEELCVCDLAWIAGRADNLVSHHLRVLRSAGLVSSRRDGKMVLYRVTDLGMTMLDAVASQIGHGAVGQ